MCNQACSKYLKQQVYNIFENRKIEVDLFSCRKTSNISYYNFRCVWPDIPKSAIFYFYYLFSNFLFLCSILRKKWVMKLIFHMQIKTKITYKLILWFLIGMAKHSQNSRVCNVFTISWKRSWRWSWVFSMQINITISYNLTWKLWVMFFSTSEYYH